MEAIKKPAGNSLVAAFVASVMAWRNHRLARRIVKLIRECQRCGSARIEVECYYHGGKRFEEAATVACHRCGHQWTAWL